MSEDPKLTNEETFKYIVKHGELFSRLQQHAKKRAELLSKKDLLMARADEIRRQLAQVEEELERDRCAPVQMATSEEREMFNLFKELYIDMLEENGYHGKT